MKRLDHRSRWSKVKYTAYPCSNNRDSLTLLALKRTYSSKLLRGDLGLRFMWSIIPLGVYYQPSEEASLTGEIALKNFHDPH